MHITPASEEFRKVAEHLTFTLDDLVPVPHKDKRWRIPQQSLKEQPAFLALIRLYNQKQVLDTMERAKARGRRITIKKGPEWLLLGKGHSTVQNELFVGIVGTDLLALPSDMSRAPVSQTNTEICSNEPLPNSRDHNSEEHAHRDKHLCAASEIQNVTGDDGVGNLVPGESKHSQPGNGISLETLKEELKVVIKSPSGVRYAGSPSWGVGDILELHDLEELQVETGVLPVLGMSFEEEALLAEDR